MGGEWPNLEILPEAEVIILHENNQVSKIFPPKSYRPLILEELHRVGSLKLFSLEPYCNTHDLVLARTSTNILSLVPSALNCNQAKHMLKPLG